MEKCKLTVKKDLWHWSKLLSFSSLFFLFFCFERISTKFVLATLCCKPL